MKTPVLASTTLSRNTLEVPALRLTPLAAALAAGLFVLPSAANAATIAVVNGGCTLIDAITAANSDTATGLCPAGSGADTIVLPLNSTQTLTAVNNTTRAATGLPLITSNITIQGNGSTILRAPTAPDFHPLAVDFGATLALQNSTISGGKSSVGGGIINFGSVSLSNSTLSGNTAVGSSLEGYGGGGLWSRGTGARATLTDSTVSGNSSTIGGGIHNVSGAQLVLVRSTVSGNRADRDGGGIAQYQLGTVTLINSTVSGNRAGAGPGNNHGGGLYDRGGGSFLIYDSTVTGNTATGKSGGGMYMRGTDLVIHRSLVAGNISTAAGGFNEVANFVTGLSTLSLSNNLFGHQGETNAQAFSSSFAPGVTDINATSDGTTGILLPTVLTDILDTTLADNGGPTQTHALVDMSPAIDAGGESGGPESDQRGFGRPVGAATDIGAFEFGGEAAGDITPDLFTFTDQTNVPLNSQRTSNTVTITGVNTPTTVSVSGGEFSIGCNGTFSTIAAPINSGQTVCMRHTSSDSFSTAVNTTLTIGGVSDIFTSTTLAADTTPDQFTFTDATNVALNSVQTSNTVTIAGINTAAPISVSGGMFSIGCTAIFTDVATTISNGQTVCVKHTSSGSFSTAVNTTLTIGTVSDIFTSTTMADPNADLSIVKTAAQSSVFVGDNLMYTLTLSNAGPATGGGVMVTDSLPASTSFVSASASQGTCVFASPTVTCNLGSIASSGMASITLVARANAGGPIVNTSSVSSTSPDPNAANNSSSTTVAANKRATGITAKPALASVLSGSLLRLNVRFEAQLQSNASVAGRPVVFTAGAASCTGTTNASGVATCSLNVLRLLATTLNFGYTASFTGDTMFLPSSVRAPALQVLGIPLF